MLYLIRSVVPMDISSNSRINQHTSPARVIAVTGGKGGVGKTSVSVNLAIAMSGLGHDVTLLDADLGLANIAVLLGLHPLRNLSHVINGDCNLKDILIEGPKGINIVPAASGVRMMGQLTPTQHAALVHAFDELADNTDVLLIDTSAGLSESVLSFCSASQEVIIVVCNEPASLTDAYAMIKILNQEYGVARFRVLANMADRPDEGRELFIRLAKVTEKFLDVVLDFMGTIPRDNYLIKAVQRQQPLLLTYPSSPAAIAFKKLALVVDKWPRKSVANGKLEFFMERMMRAQPVNQYGAPTQ